MTTAPDEITIERHLRGQPALIQKAMLEFLKRGEIPIDQLGPSPRTMFDEWCDEIARADEPPSLDDLTSNMAYCGRNFEPAMLNILLLYGLLTPELAQTTVASAWTSCEFPGRALPRSRWRELFALSGFTVLTPADVQLADRPTEPVRLYRGASPSCRRGWSWTSDLSIARRFAGQPPDGYNGRRPGAVFTAVVDPWRIFCQILERNEHEYVVDTWRLRIVEHVA